MNEIKITFDDSPNYALLRLIDDEKRPVIFVFPGGGYDHTSSREGIIVAKEFEAVGYHSITFFYREEKNSFESLQEQIRKLIFLLRQGDYQAKTRDITGLGFSAGAHLVGLVSTSSEPQNSLFDFLILSYPVVTTSLAFCHQTSFKNLLKEKFDGADLDKYSLEKQVNSSFPPCFIWGTAQDKSVRMENSLLLLEALNTNGVRYEYHLFPNGPHGISLGKKETAVTLEMVDKRVQSWVKLALTFLKEERKSRNKESTKEKPGSTD